MVTDPAIELAAFDRRAPNLVALLLAHLRARAGRVAVLILLALLLAGVAVLPPVLVGRLVDVALAGGVGSGAILGVTGAIALAALADAGLTLARRRLAIRNEMAMRASAARARFQASVRLPLPAFGGGNEAALIRSFDDLDAVVEFLAGRALDLFAELAVIAGYAVLLLAVDARLALVFFLLASGGLGTSVLLGRATRRAADNWLPLRDRRFGFIVEALTSMLTIKTLGAHGQMAAPFGREQDSEQAGMHAWRERMALADAATRFWAVATPAVGTATGVLMLVAGQLSAGSLVLFLSVSGGLVAALSAAHALVQELHQARASLGRMRALTGAAPEVLGDTENAMPAEAALRGERLRFTHAGSATPTLDGLELAIRPGEHVAIVGRSGEGKTTLAHVLARLLEAEAGDIGLGDGASGGLDAHRRAVLLVPHEIAVFSASLRENVRLWDSGVDDAAVRAALERAGLGTLLAQFADGLETELGARGNPLSAGQRQRLGLARMFLRRPAVLILDEATSALDARTEREVLDNVREYMRGRIVIAITHREAVAASFDRVLRMRGGRLEDAGVPD